jgi:hypothetical protein
MGRGLPLLKGRLDNGFLRWHGAWLRNMELISIRFKDQAREDGFAKRIF